MTEAIGLAEHPRSLGDDRVAVTGASRKGLGRCIAVKTPWVRNRDVVRKKVTANGSGRLVVPMDHRVCKQFAQGDAGIIVNHRLNKIPFQCHWTLVQVRIDDQIEHL